MRKYVTYLFILIVGVIIGSTIVGYLSVRASHVYIELFHMYYEQEQEQLAAHARKEGEFQRELAYRKNVFDMFPPNEVKSLKNIKATWGLGFPFYSLILEKISDYPNRDKLNETNKGIKLARLADTLERLGKKDEAAEQWKESARLMGHNNIDKAKEMSSVWHKIEDEWLANEGTLSSKSDK